MNLVVAGLYAIILFLSPSCNAVFDTVLCIRFLIPTRGLLPKVEVYVLSFLLLEPTLRTYFAPPAVATRRHVLLHLSLLDLSLTIIALQAQLLLCITVIVFTSHFLHDHNG